MVDYTAIANTAKRLVSFNGRKVTIVRFAESDNEDKPWLGTGAVEGVTAATVKTSAVFVPPSSAKELGMSTINNALLQVSTQIMIVAPGPTVTEDLSTFHAVQDQGSRWVIQWVDTLRPADMTLLYFIGVKR